MIQTFHLTKNYGRFQAVADVNLQVNDGEVFGFLGLNGAGKTTLMRMLTGLLRPTSGYACIGDVEVRGPQDVLRLIGTVSFVSQEMHFYEQASLCELLNLYATLAQTTPDGGLAFARKVSVPADAIAQRQNGFTGQYIGGILRRALGVDVGRARLAECQPVLTYGFADPNYGSIGKE